MELPTPTNLFRADIIPLAAEDANTRLKAAFRADRDPRKVDLSIRSYQDEHGNRPVFPAVEMAVDMLRKTDHRTSHEYLPVAGLAEFNNGAARLVLGADSPAIQEEKTISFQTISGTGALHLGATFLSKFLLRRCHSTSPQPVVCVSDPTWGNHHKIFANVGFSTEAYPYFSASTKGLDCDGMLEHLQDAPSGSIIVLQACGHNPTGVDPDQMQWDKIAETIRQRGHVPFFDCTYQGMVSGDLDQDAWAIRHFTERGMEVCIAQSFAKNCGLYGQRTGCLHVVTASKDAARRISSQLTLLQRCEISSPPSYGAQVASLILNDGNLLAKWKANLRIATNHIVTMRKTLRSRLEATNTPGTWNHITDQTGWYCFLGLSDAQVVRLRTDFHIYTTRNGRISVAGLNPSNMDYVSMALDQIIRKQDEVAPSLAATSG